MWVSKHGQIALVCSHVSLRFIFVYVVTNAYQTIAERVPKMHVRDAVAQCTGLILTAAAALSSVVMFHHVQHSSKPRLEPGEWISL